MKSYFGLILGCLIFLLIFVVWKPFSKQKAPQDMTVVEETEEASAPKVSSTTTVVADVKESTPTQNETAASAEELQKKNFAIALQGLSSCLGLQSVSVSESELPTEATLLDALKLELNDPVIQSEDWQVTKLALPNGEEREIRINMDYENEDSVSRVLKYSKIVMQNGQGVETPIELPADQTRDPSDTFIASLEKDGTVKSREKANRMYYQSGEELLLTEKNGLLTEIEINRTGKSWKCRDLDKAAFASPCTCI